MVNTPTKIVLVAAGAILIGIIISRIGKATVLITQYNIQGRLGTKGTVTLDPSGYLVWSTTSITSPIATAMYYGISGDIPLIGDWYGTGIEGPGVYRPLEQNFYLKKTFTSGIADVLIMYGKTGDIPISWYQGSVSAGNRDGIGVIRLGTTYLDENLSGGNAELQIPTSQLSCPKLGIVGQCLVG